jgi:hypothetical protein
LPTKEETGVNASRGSKGVVKKNGNLDKNVVARFLPVPGTSFDSKFQNQAGIELIFIKRYHIHPAEIIHWWDERHLIVWRSGGTWLKGWWSI